MDLIGISISFPIVSVFSCFTLIFISNFVLTDETYGKINGHPRNFVSGTLRFLTGTRTIALRTEKFDIQIVSKLNSFSLHSFLSE